MRNGFISVSGGAAVGLDGEGSIVEGVQAGGGIIANGIVRNNTVFGDGTDADIGISATGVITGNYVSSIRNGDGIVAGAGSTVLGNTSINNTGAGISASCPANLIGNTAVGNGQNLVLNGKGCINKDNVAPLQQQ